MLLSGSRDPGTLFIKTVKTTSRNASYTQSGFYEAWRLVIQRYGIFNPYTGKGAIEGLLPHGPHNIRDVLATHVLIRTRLEEMDQNSFTCSIVNRARQRGGEAHITVRINKGRGHFFGDINFVNEAHAADNTSHGGISVEADEYQLYLAPSRLMGGREEGMKFTAQRAAEWLWNQFVERAGIEYE